MFGILEYGMVIHSISRLLMFLKYLSQVRLQNFTLVGILIVTLI